MSQAVPEHLHYKGFDITAEATPGVSGGWLPYVIVRRQGGESRLYPPSSGLPTRNAALRAAMQHGIDAVDGKVKAFDPTKIP